MASMGSTLSMRSLGDVLETGLEEVLCLISIRSALALGEPAGTLGALAGVSTAIPGLLR